MFNQYYLRKSPHTGKEVQASLNYFYDPDIDCYRFLSQEAFKNKSEEEIYALFVERHVRGNNLEALKWMIEKLHYSLEIRDGQGNTPLMIAASYGYLDIVVWLLQQKVNLHQTNHEENNAYFLAVNSDHHEIANVIGLAQARDRFTTSLSFWKTLENNSHSLKIDQQLAPSAELIAKSEANTADLLYDEEDDVYYKPRKTS